MTETIPTDIWEKDPENPGYLKYVGQRRVDDVFTDLRKALFRTAGTDGSIPELENALEYFSPNSIAPELWPKGRTIVYAVTGSNEGHYIHVDVISPEGKSQGVTNIILGKTFDGFDAAWAFAGRVAKLLGV